MLIAAAVLVVLWIGVIAVVVGLCASAARGDRVLARAVAKPVASYTLPRRATWRAVRSSSFRSTHSDQLAT
jgi:hypothetical protein